MATIFYDYLPVSSSKEAYNINRKWKKKGKPRSTVPLTIEQYQALSGSNLTPNRKKVEVASIILEYSSFNRLQFNVSSHAPGFFVLFFPYGQHWRAYVNSEKSQIYRANGIFQSVWVTEGKSSIEFRYWSWSAFWGMFISWGTLSLVGIYFVRNILSSPARIFSIFCVLSLATSVFFWWYLSLYSGDNLGTKYMWSYKTQNAFETSK